MASVFLSYDREDVARARPIAAALEKAGHSVWWDRRIGGGSEFAKEIERALESSDLVVVLWSASSIESPWVRDEAGAGRDKRRLVPLSLEGTLPPLGFRQFQSIQLGSWRGRGKVPRLAEILAAIERQASTSAELEPIEIKKVAQPRRGPSLNQWVAIAVVIGLAFVAIGLLIGRPWERGSPGAPMIAVSASDSSPASQVLARDLLVDLGRLQFAKSGSMTLVNAAGQSRPDLVLQADDTSRGGIISATLSLLNGSDQGLLWSTDFKASPGNRANLKEQLAFTAGGVLECALDGLSQKDGALKPQTFKTYVSACAELSGLTSSDAGDVLPMLHQVTDDAPHFAAAWGKLLVAEAGTADLAATNGVPDEEARRELRRHIEAARRSVPGIPEADLAESVLVQPTAYEQKLNLINRAAQHNRDNPTVLSFRAAALQSVGRMDDGVADAQRATQLDPFSPTLLENYMYALVYSGLVDSARDELTRIETRWPQSDAAKRAWYDFNFRYGDPKIALPMPETKGGTAGVRYLIEARIDPSPANVKQLVDFLRGRKDRFKGDAGSARLRYYTRAMAMFHQHDELFDTLNHWFRPSDLAVISNTYFYPELHEFRKEPRFFAIMKAAGLVD
ncbi:MAG TPA: TIR domain-containing protein, partial [Sphingomicrobium sp.]|nr:TIR domain-containing protein [Sphingomicrobium sp.]